MKKWVGQFLLYFVCLLGLIELGLRTLWTNPYLPAKFPPRGVLLRENQRGADAVKEYQGKPFHFQTDPDGFVWPSRTVPEKPYYMAFLGDSSVEGAQLPEQLRWPNQVIDQLRNHGWIHLDALNDSHSGATTRDSVELFYNKTSFFEPAIVLHSSGFTDLAYNFTLGRDLPRLQDASSAPNPSQSFYLLAYLKQHYRPGTSNPVGASGPNQAPKFYEADTTQAVQCYARNLELLVFLARQRGCKVYLLTQGSSYGSGWMTREPNRVATLRYRDGGLSEACMQKAMAQINAAIHAVAAKAGVSVIEVADALGNDPSMFLDEVHLSEKGQKTVADLIIARMQADFPHPPSEAAPTTNR